MRKGQKLTTVQRARLREVNFGKKHTAATRAKISESLIGNQRTLGYRHTAAARAKISAANRGKIVSAVTRAKMSIAQFGHEVSDSIREKMRGNQRALGCKRSVAHRKAISKVHRGKAISKAHRLRLAEAYIDRVVINKDELCIRGLLSKRFKFSSVIVGTRVPDFVDEENKIIVEYFGIFHTQKFVGYPRWKEAFQRDMYFRRYGYRTIIIWYDDLPEVVTEKLKGLQ